MKNQLSEFTKKTFKQGKSNDPYKIEFIGDRYMDNPELHLISYGKDHYDEVEITDLQNIPGFDEKNIVYWLNINGIHETELIKSLGIKHGIHRLALEDILDTTERPKMQNYEDYLFFTVKSLLPLKEDDLETEHISFVVGKNYLLSFQEKKNVHFEHIRYRLRQNIGIVRERGTDYLLYLLLDAILDNYFETINNLEMEIHALTMMNDVNPKPDVVRDIERYKKVLFNIKRSLEPLMEAVDSLGKGISDIIEKPQYKYFIDLNDQCRRLLDNIESLNMRLESGLNLFYSLQGHKMNEIMKTLTVIATIFIPLTFVAGVYGMNFKNMPELVWEWGYFTVLAIMITMFISMMIYFKKKKWF